MTEDISLTKYSRVFGLKPRKKKLWTEKDLNFFIVIWSVNEFIDGDLLDLNYVKLL